MFHLPVWSLAVLAPLLVVAALWDLRFRRIPNALCATIAGLGLIDRMVSTGMLSMLSSTAAALVVVALLLQPWSRGGIGGGDVKLAAAAAVWVGLRDLPEYLLVGALAGGVLAAIAYLWSGRVARAEVRANLWLAALTSRVPDPTKGLEGRVSVPYGVAVATGALVTLCTRA